MTVAVDHLSLSLLVHAPSKTGKTTLAATSPPPILILDAEGGSKFLPYPSVRWDPLQGPPPVYDGTWHLCIVIVSSFQVLERCYEWLQSGQHHFNSIIVDSITEVQRRCKTNLKGTETLQIQDWGRLLTLMDEKIRGYRDLTEHPTNPVQVVVFIAETRQQDGKWRPYMQGQIGTSLPYWMDIVGYLYTDLDNDTNGQPTVEVRRLLIKQHPEYEAGERVQGRLGDVVTNPDITQMLYNVYGVEPDPAGQTADTPPPPPQVA